MKLTHSIVAAVIAGLFALPAVAQTPVPTPGKDAVKPTVKSSRPTARK